MSAVGTGKVLQVCGGPIGVRTIHKIFSMSDFVLTSDRGTLIMPFGPVRLDHSISYAFFDDGGLVEEQVDGVTMIVYREIGKPMTCGDAIRCLVESDDSASLTPLLTPMSVVMKLVADQVANEKANLLDRSGRSNIFFVRNRLGEIVLVEVSWATDSEIHLDVLLASFASVVDLDSYDRIYHPRVNVTTQTQAMATPEA